MGGAERTARKRRQEQQAAQRAVAAARKRSDRNKVAIVVVVLVVLAAAVITGVVVTSNQKSESEGAIIPPKQVTTGITAVREGGVVVVGNAGAKVTLDVYEDFLCPACGQFEARNATAIEEKVKDGSVKVRYHLLNMLNAQSDPAGYSTDSANAALCAADAGQFPAFHASLFAAQPEEGARGYDDNQLVRLGQDVGITSGDFAGCVTSGKYDQLSTEEFQRARADQSLQQEYNGRRSFGTPTVTAGGKVVDTSDPNWLTTLVNAG